MNETHETRAPTAGELKALIEAERAALPFVHWRDEAGAQRIMMLPAEGRVTIGRRAQSDISLPSDPEVSRAHALLEPIGEEWMLIDDGLSRNGSFINGNRVQGRQRLHNRDSMCFGNTRVIYHEPIDPEGGASTARALGAPSSVPLTDDAAQGADRLVPPDGRLDLVHAGDQPSDRRRGVPERRRGEGAPACPVRALRRR